MRKIYLLMLLVLGGFVIIHSNSISNAASLAVIDIGEETTTEGGTGQSSTEATTQSSDENKFGVVNDDSTTESTTSSGEKQKIFNKSGEEAMEESLNSNDVQIMGDDWEFGDDILPEVETEGFFQHVYNKLWQATTGFQKVVCIFAVIFMLISLVMILVSSIGNRARLPWYLLSFLISAIVFTCSLYAPQIMSAFNNWFTTE